MPSLCSYPRADGNNIVLAPGDLALAQALLHISSMVLDESHNVFELLLTCIERVNILACLLTACCSCKDPPE